MNYKKEIEVMKNQIYQLDSEVKFLKEEAQKLKKKLEQ